MTIINYMARIRFGAGEIAALAEELALLGVRRPLITTDRGVAAAGVLARLQGCLPMPAAVFLDTPSNPTEAAILAALEVFRANDCDGIVGLGGGSPIDLGKAVALLASQGGALADYVLTAGGMDRIRPLPIPVVAVPTTGAGAEVGRASVCRLANGRKTVIGSLHLVPRTAICDPALTVAMPPWLTAATGVDAITHCVESYLSPVDNPPAAAIALDGLARAARWIERATADGGDLTARSEMMMAALEGGLTFQKGLGAIHALSMPLGELGLHHGQLNAILLPAVLRFNQPAAAARYADLATAIGLPAGADLADWAAALNARLGIPTGLGALGVDRAAIPAMAAAALADNATRTNPRPPSQADYERLFAESW